MTPCPVCREGKLGAKVPVQGRLVCFECYRAAKRRPRLGRLVYWWRILRAPKVIFDAELLD